MPMTKTHADPRAIDTKGRRLICAGCGACNCVECRPLKDGENCMHCNRPTAIKRYHPSNPWQSLRETEDA